MSLYDHYAASTTPTDAPCPDWCTEGHGHPYQSDGEGLWRQHTRPLADLSPWSLDLCLAQTEYLGERPDAPEVVIGQTPDTSAGCSLNPTTLRQLAARVLDGSDELARLHPENAAPGLTHHPRRSPDQRLRTLVELEDALEGEPTDTRCPTWCVDQGHLFRSRRSYEARGDGVPAGVPLRIHRCPVVDLSGWGLDLSVELVEWLSDTDSWRTEPARLYLREADPPALTGAQRLVLNVAALSELARQLAHAADMGDAGGLPARVG